MKWSNQAWEAVQPVFKKTIEHPFIQELMNGTLPKEKFLFYIEQDAIYLSSYSKLMTGIATQLSQTDHINSFISFASDNLEQEKELHKLFVTEPYQPELLEATPTCLLYTSYLLKHLSVSPIEVTVAAVLPCFVVYQEVGLYIYRNQTSENNPYKAWIETYAGEEHRESVRKALSICNELAQKSTPEIRKAMLDSFITSAKIEHLFWDSAYRKEQWII